MGTCCDGFATGTVNTVALFLQLPYAFTTSVR